MLRVLISVIWALATVWFTAAEANSQQIYEVDPTRELSRTESIVPTFYREYGPFLYFIGQPAYAQQCCSSLPAYSNNQLWRLDSRDNSVKMITTEVGVSSYEDTIPYAIVNDRLIYFGHNKIVSADLDGKDIRILGEFRDERVDNRGVQVQSFNGHVYLPVEGTNGRSELLRTDGTVAGTTKVDLCTSEGCYYSPRQMNVSANRMFFVATSSQYENALWSVSPTGAVSKLPQATLSDYEFIQVTEGGVFFKSPTQLWFSDGTAAGSHAIELQTDNDFFTVNESVKLGELVVVASDAIYVIDEQGKGKTTFIDIDPRESNGYQHSNYPQQLTVLNERVYFIAQFDEGFAQTFKLMAIDGTSEGVYEVFEFDSSSYSDSFKIIGAKGSKIVFLRDTEDSKEVWVSDGSNAGTKLLSQNGVPTNLWDMEPWHFINDDLFYSGSSPEHGVELWRTDGSEQGTLLAKDLGYGQTRVQKGPIATNGSDIYYIMQKHWYGTLDGISGHHVQRELWKTDGRTMASTRLEQYPDKTMLQMIAAESGLFWWVYNESAYDELTLQFFSFEKETITTVIPAISNQCTNYSAKNRKMAVVGHKYYFEAPRQGNDDSYTCQLWVSDGTVEGTFVVSDIPDTSLHSERINQITASGNEVFYSLYVNSDEFMPLRSVIFRSDGTVEGTKEAFRLPADNQDFPPYIENLVFSDSGLFVITALESRNLWHWNGSEFKKIVSNAADLGIWSLAPFKEGIAYVFNNSLWHSDGTDEGTYQAVHLLGRPLSLYPTADKQKVLFVTRGPLGADQLWVSDGTEAGTYTSELELEGGLFVRAITGDDVYTIGYSGEYGREFYQEFRRFSLSTGESELLTKRRVSDANYEPKVVVAQGRVFLGQESEILSRYGPGFGGPYVTAKLGDGDMDEDGVLDDEDHLPLHYFESVDTDNDFVGNNADPDDDNDGLEDTVDAFPMNASEWADHDNDGIGDTEDKDDDNDGVDDWFDSYPRDSTKSVNELPQNEHADQNKDNQGASSSATSSGGGAVPYQYLLLLFMLCISKQIRRNLVRYRAK